ncbi:MFS transporter, partial [Gemmiger formicilis]
QQLVKESLAGQWGMDSVMGVTAVAAALGLGRLISLPFAGPLSDKFGRKISVVIGCASYVIFFVGIAFSPNMTIAYVAAVLGGIANSFLDTATYRIRQSRKLFTNTRESLQWESSCLSLWHSFCSRSSSASVWERRCHF